MFHERYAIWIRRNPAQRKIIESFLSDKEAELAKDPDFSTISSEQLNAIETFKDYLGSKAEVKKGETTKTPVDDSSPPPDNEEGKGRESHVSPDEEERISRSLRSPNVSVGSLRRRRLSRGSSVSSKRSRMSAQSSLSPLYEDDDGEEDEEEVDDETVETSPSERNKRSRLSKRNRPASLGSMLSSSTIGKAPQSTIEEGSVENSGGDDESD